MKNINENEVNEAIALGKKRFILKVPVGAELIPLSGGEYEIIFGNSFFASLEECTTNAMKFKKNNNEEFWVSRNDLFRYSSIYNSSVKLLNYYKVDAIID